jgi:L-threonylcarbamoyladenylate synthase
LLSEDYKKAVSVLKSGGVGVLPTDTLYGLVGSALSKEAVEKIYQLKGRDYNKPFIVLLSEAGDLGRFNIEADDFTRGKLAEFWPGPVSVVLPCPLDEYEYLHRGEKTLAFRVPDDDDLRDFLKMTGPLVAPSANHQGEESAKNIKEAEEYFGDKVSFYINGGELGGEPSTLVRIQNGELGVLRQGSYKLK